MKVAIRTEGHTVRAYVASLDGTHKEEIASIARRLLQERPDLWERWKALVSEAGCYVIGELAGVPVDVGPELHPDDLERPPQA